MTDIPAAWFRGVMSPSSPNSPAEYDVELAWGDDPPSETGWTPLYREPPSRPHPAAREAAERIVVEWRDHWEGGTIVEYMDNVSLFHAIASALTEQETTLRAEIAHWQQQFERVNNERVAEARPYSDAREVAERIAREAFAPLLAVMELAPEAIAIVTKQAAADLERTVSPLMAENERLRERRRPEERKLTDLVLLRERQIEAAEARVARLEEALHRARAVALAGAKSLYPDNNELLRVIDGGISPEAQHGQG